MDTQSFDSPKPKTRRYKKTTVESVKCSHSIVAVVPHTGWQLCVDEVIDEQSFISDAGVYREYSEYPQWLDTGGVLLIELNHINRDNNRQICELFSAAGSVTYIHEPYSTRFKEVIFVEQLTGKSMDQVLFTDDITVKNDDMVFDECATFASCWDQIFEAWRTAYPGKKYVAVSERWAQKEYPWPHQIDVNANHNSDMRWRQELSSTGQTHSIHDKYFSQFLQKVPMYAK